MIVVIAHQSIVDADAIGHDIFGMYDSLLHTGTKVLLFGEFLSNVENREVITFTEAKRIVKNADNILIYHHSIYWEEGFNLLKESECKVVVRYHNITPPEFFKDYSKLHFEKTSLGRKQTSHIANTRKVSLWLCDSLFNILDLEKEGIIGSNEVLPPFHRVEAMENIQGNRKIISVLINDPRKYLFFIGRVAPNKGHKMLIEIAYHLESLYPQKYQLLIAGGFDDNTKSYTEELFQLVDSLGIQEVVKFLGKIPASDVKSYYLSCDAFLCTSEHEGFCVPLLEAQYFELPIIALDTSAISETLGPNQLCLKERDPVQFAVACNIVANESDVRELLVNEGRINYSQRFSISVIKNRFLNILKGLGMK